MSAAFSVISSQCLLCTTTTNDDWRKIISMIMRIFWGEQRQEMPPEVSRLYTNPEVNNKASNELSCLYAKGFDFIIQVRAREADATCHMEIAWLFFFSLSFGAKRTNCWTSQMTRLKRRKERGCYRHVSALDKERTNAILLNWNRGQIFIKFICTITMRNIYKILKCTNQNRT